MTEQQIRDKNGRVIGTVRSYPDSAQDREALIRREGEAAAEALRLPRRRPREQH